MRNIILSLFAVISIVAISYSHTWAFIIPEAKLSFHIVDEQGAPVEKADISVGFDQPVMRDKGTNEDIVRVLTDAKGACWVKHKTVSGVSYHINKNGYYEYYGEYQFRKAEGLKWQPWDQVVNVVLRKIENPVPMYARDSKMSKEIKLPDITSGVGFDLMEYDWVAPYGKGLHSDLILKLNNKNFKFHPTYVIEYEYDSELTITFSNRYDGIQLIKDNRRFGSEFKLPRYAPEDGYNKSISATRKLSLTEPVKQSFKDDNNYIFRIRSEEKDGKLVRAMYGKIHGDIKFYPKGPNTAVIIFKYYFNPDYTRNLEYDPKRNLFKNLEKIEYVGLE
ncbi:hypothetical protein Gura_3014 [Geotalea uraniireducens Rf4]|uniref:DUF4198 domain-containing protein n=2 Tax=Geotalea uraniireducens TaxID=351604 RepID=A5G5W8_GEOUR|nr:hypothetical protein Gura_3014 [Geotalea uraniireducens Rf4]